MIGPRLPNGRFYGRTRHMAPLKSRATKKATTVTTITDTEKIARRVAKNVMNKELETKHRDGALTANPDWSGDVYYMFSDPSGATTITQGVGVAQYIGESVKVSSINLRFQAQYADSLNMFRVMVIQARGLFAPVTMADILQSVGNLRAPLTALDIDFDQRYSILYDSGPLQLSSVDKPAIIRNVHISGRFVRKTTFSDASGTAEDGGIYLGVLTDSSVVAHPQFLAYWRINYKDA